MINRIGICAAAVLATGFGSALTPTHVYAAGISGDCPVEVVRNAMAVAEKQCKRDGGEVVVTYLSCEGNDITMHWVCA